MTSRRRPRVYVELPEGLDAAVWQQRHLSDRAPDLTPYGLHRLDDLGFDVRFRRVPLTPRRRRWAERINPVFEGAQWGPVVFDPGRDLRRTADVLLSMDERTGIPSALTSDRVVSGVAWLDDPGALSPWHRRLVCAALHRMAAVFTECSGMVRPLVEGFGVPADKVHLIRLGIDVDFFTPAPYPVPAPTEPPMVFSVGDDRMRDHDCLLAAMARLRERWPEVGLELGTTLPVTPPGPWCVVHPRRLDQHVREFYARSSVVAVALHPNVQGSGLTVVLEAMASGRPIVVTDNPGMSDYVVDGVTGVLVPPEDDEAMARAVADLLASPDRAAAMGRAGRARVEENFRSSHMVSDLAGVLRTVVGEPIP